MLQLFVLFPLLCLKNNDKSNLSVTLEPVQTEIAAEPIAEEIPEVSAESTAEIQNPIPEVEEPIAEIEETIPKKRGRPPKAAPKEKAKKPIPKKAVIMKPPSESSSDDALNHDDMETLLLDYLVKRKTSQQNARRQMWSQLAGLS